MELTVSQIGQGIRRANRAMVQLEQELNSADARIGDGDTGSMLARVIGTMAAAEVESSASVSDAFARLARAGMSATGSSLGTLFSGAMLLLSRQTKERIPSWDELSSLLNAARDNMMARGGASLGDKTVLDMLDAVAAALQGKSNAADAGTAAVTAAEQTLQEFRDRPCKMGRAKFFSEKSVGLDDPGMLAFASLTRALVAAS